MGAHKETHTKQHTMNKWLTVIDGKTEKEHTSKADAVFWAQGTHCTEARPSREGEAYRLGRTLIVRRKVWESWQASNV